MTSTTRATSRGTRPRRPGRRRGVLAAQRRRPGGAPRLRGQPARRLDARAARRAHPRARRVRSEVATRRAGRRGPAGGLRHGVRRRQCGDRRAVGAACSCSSCWGSCCSRSGASAGAGGCSGADPGRPGSGWFWWAPSASSQWPSGCRRSTTCCCSGRTSRGCPWAWGPTAASRSVRPSTVRRRVVQVVRQVGTLVPPADPAGPLEKQPGDGEQHSGGQRDDRR